MEYCTTLGAQPGENKPQNNPCKLLDFALVNLAAGQEYAAKTEGREICAIVLGGKATFVADGKRFEKVGGRPNAIAGLPHSVYLPAGIEFSIKGEGNVQVALCSAPSDMEIEPYVIAPNRVTTGVWGAANFKRYFRQILTTAGQPDLPARRLIVGETVVPSGNWATYPPHRHETDNLPVEAFHEEMYYFQVAPADGFGICRFYIGGTDVEENYTIRNNTLLMAPKGYHSLVSAPGYTTWYIWFLAGEHRTQATVDDPTLGWVSRTVPMLTELGH